MRVDVFTIFPSLVDGYSRESVLGRARSQGILDLRVRDLRSGAGDARRSVDDSPFGGGPGMVMMPGPVFTCVEDVEQAEGLPRPLFLMSPRGRRFDQSFARELSSASGFSLVCGRYEGVDQRVSDHLCDGEILVADVVLAGGELAALVVVEAVARLLPGVLGNDSSATEESFATGLLEHPQYTRPADYRGWKVPEILLSGDHGRVASWRQAQALATTLRSRPDLIEARGGLTEDEVALVAAAGELELLADHGYDAGPGQFPA